jgi:Ca-activated chloride channel family protein
MKKEDSNPAPSATTTATAATVAPGTLVVSLTPRKPALPASGSGQLEVLLRVQAPAAENGAQQPRTPLALALVIDRSGSMSGDKLEAAKACARDVVQRLHAEDEVCVVVYDDEAQVLMPLCAAAQARDSIDGLLASFSDGGSTDLHAGWLHGAQQVAGRTSSSRMCRVVLLSDGQANHGETDEGRICDQVRLLAQAGVTTTTVGLGEGFNESLMTAMAVAGQGNALYGERAEDLAEAFDAEIGLLAHLAWRNVRLVSGSATSRWKLLNDYAKTAEGAWSLPSVAAGAEAWAVFTVPMDAAGRAQTRSRQGMALHVSVTACDADGKEHEVRASLAALPTVDDAQWAALAEDELVARRSVEAQAAQLQARAREAVQAGNWEEARRLLGKVEALASDNPWLQGVLAQMHELLRRRDRVRMSKELAYASFSMSRRIAEIDESAHFVAAMESEKVAYLRRKPSQGRSSGS